MEVFDLFKSTSADHVEKYNNYLQYILAFMYVTLINYPCECITSAAFLLEADILCKVSYCIIC